METVENSRLSPTKSCKGFVLVFVLPLISIGMFATVYLSHYLFQSWAQQELKSTLLKAIFSNHHLQAIEYRKLKHLNPAALFLAAQSKLIDAKIATATATLQLELIPILLKQKRINHNLRQQLDNKQNFLINKIRVLQSLEGVVARMRLEKAVLKLNNRFKNFLKITYRMNVKKSAEFALVAKTKELAPQYLEKLDFEKLQTVHVSSEVCVDIYAPSSIRQLFQSKWRLEYAVSSEVRNSYVPKITNPATGRSSPH